jgi:2'-5' RNA ligase
LSFLALDLAHETEALFDRLPVPNLTEREENKHVTLFYIPKEVETLKSFYTATEILRRVVQETPPPTLLCSERSSFSPGDKGFPIICPVVGPGLIELRARLAKLFDLNGIQYSKKFPKYNPHVTLGYSPVGVETKPLRSPIVWTPQSVTYYFSSTSEENEQNMKVLVPFSSSF